MERRGGVAGVRDGGQDVSGWLPFFWKPWVIFYYQKKTHLFSCHCTNLELELLGPVLLYWIMMHEASTKMVPPFFSAILASRFFTPFSGTHMAVSPSHGQNQGVFGCPVDACSP